MILGLGLCGVTSTAQDLKAISADYDWGGAATWDPAWDSAYQGTEVLDDKLSIRVKKKRPQFLALFFERRQVIRFGSQEDVLRYGRFTLPESLDPAYDRRGMPWSAANEPARPMWFNARLDVFAARIIRPDGTWGEVGAFSDVHTDQVTTMRTMEAAWTYVLDLQSIAPGDVVEVRWKYMIPYDTNWEQTLGWRAFEWMDNWSRLTSWRVFFHSDLPIRHQRIELVYNTHHGIQLHSEAFYSIKEEDEERRVVWEHDNLPGCMNEVNARPGLDLPHISVTMEPEELRYWTRDRLSGMPFQQPYWLYVLRQREAKAFWWQQVARKNVPDRQGKLFNEFVERTTAGIPDSAKARRMEAMHEVIAEGFNYENDRLWYQDLDRSLPQMGDQLNKERIREISRYDLYAKLANAVRARYVIGYLMDKRVGIMDDHWVSPLWDNDFIMGVKDDEGTLWMHPKRGAVGLFANELPFYWQGGPVLLSDLQLLVPTIPGPPKLFLELPKNDGAFNTRVSEIKLIMSDARDRSTGSARVLLRGQFSTCGRNAYQGLPMDRTIHPFYGDVLQRLGSGTKRVWSVKSLQQDPPFRCLAEADIALSLACVNNADSTWTLDLSPLSIHAVPADPIAAGRYLPFYWDFEQDDRTIIDLRFPYPMKFLNIDALNATVSTPNATLVRSVVSDSPEHIRIESLLRVTGLRELPEDAKALEQLIQLARGEGFVVHGKPIIDHP